MRPSATPADTTAEASEIVVNRVRSMTIDERVALLQEMHQDVQTLAVAGIRLQFPGIEEDELRFELFRRRYGDELALEVRDQMLG